MFSPGRKPFLFLAVFFPFSFFSSLYTIRTSPQKRTLLVFYCIITTRNVHGPDVYRRRISYCDVSPFLHLPFWQLTLTHSVQSSYSDENNVLDSERIGFYDVCVRVCVFLFVRERFFRTAKFSYARENRARKNNEF